MSGRRVSYWLLLLFCVLYLFVKILKGYNIMTRIFNNKVTSLKLTSEKRIRNELTFLQTFQETRFRKHIVSHYKNVATLVSSCIESLK